MNSHHVRLSAMGALLALGAFAACSTGEIERSAVDVHDDGGASAEASIDAGVVDAGDLDAGGGDDASDAADAEIPRCTVDWCETALPVTDGGTLKLMDVWVPAKNEAWAVSEEGHVLRWNGAAWSIVWTAGTALYGIWGDHENAVWVVGAGGAIFRGQGGSGWAAIPSGVTSDLVGICEGTRDTEHARNVAIVGIQGTVLRWTGDTGQDGAPVWSTSSFDPLEELYSISCSGLDVWVAGANIYDWFDSGGRLYVNGGAGWERMQAASGTQSYETYDTFVAVWAHDRQNVWTRGSFGIVHSAPATEGDVSWSRIDTYATLAEGAKRPAAIWGAAANDVWIVSTHGRIHHWDGSGVAITATAKTWDVMQSNLHAVSGSGPDDVWVVGDNVALHRNVQKVGQ